MFNLEQSITDWRKQMFATGIPSPVPLEELEIHLREQIEQQMKSGLDAAAAFETAVREIGQASQLQPEFAKIDEAKALREFKNGQFALVFSMWVFSMLFVIFLLADAGFTFRQRLAGMTGIAAALFTLYSGQFVCSFFPAILNRRIRQMIGLSGFLLCALWVAGFTHILMPHLGLDADLLPVTIYWAWTIPCGLLGGLILGLEKAALKKSLMVHS